MDNLRLVLLLLGAALIAGIWLWDTLKKRRARFGLPEDEDEGYAGDPPAAHDARGGDAPQEAVLPRFGDFAADAEPLDVAGLDRIVPREEDRAPAAQAAAPRAAKRPVAEPPAEDALIVVLTVMARSGQRFAGTDLRRVLEGAGLRHGDMDIFHFHGAAGRATATPVFSVANALKPGTFDLAALESFTTPGLTVFLRLPGEVEAQVAYESMLGTARRLAEDLDGVLCDQSRNPLTPQSENHLRERIAEFSRRQMLRTH